MGTGLRRDRITARFPAQLNQTPRSIHPRLIYRSGLPMGALPPPPPMPLPTIR